MKNCFALFLLLLSACTQKQSSTTPTDKPLVFARPGDSVGLDPARHTDGESLSITVNIFETLVGFETGTTKLEPRLAEHWEISPDGLTYTFHLRKHVTFHDGTPFNADAVLFSFERQMNLQHPAYAFGAPYEYWEAMGMKDIVRKIEKKGDYIILIHLKRTTAPFLANLSMSFLSMVSPQAVVKYGKNFDQNPVGTGPYKLQSWKKDDALVLEAWENYWGLKAKTKRVIVRVIPDNQVRLLELKRGSVHLMDFPNPSDLATLKNDSDIRLLTQEGLNIGYLAFNMKKKPLDQLLFREALSMAVDRKRIIEEIFLGYGTVAKNPMPSTVLGYNAQVPEIPYDPEKAKTLIQKINTEARELTLWAMPVARPYNPNARKMAEFIQADLQRINIKTKIISYDWGTYLDKIGKGEHDMVLIGWTGDNGDPDNFLYPLWSKKSALNIPTNNYAFYMNDRVQEWLDQAQSITQAAQRALLYRKILLQMYQDRPFLPIAHSTVVVPSRKEVEGYVIHPTGDRRFASVFLK